MDKPAGKDAAIDMVSLGSNGKVNADDGGASASALPFEQLYMVRRCFVLSQLNHEESLSVVPMEQLSHGALQCTEPKMKITCSPIEWNGQGP